MCMAARTLVAQALPQRTRRIDRGARALENASLSCKLGRPRDGQAQVPLERVRPTSANAVSSDVRHRVINHMRDEQARPVDEAVLCRILHLVRRSDCRLLPLVAFDELVSDDGQHDAHMTLAACVWICVLMGNACMRADISAAPVGARSAQTRNQAALQDVGDVLFPRTVEGNLDARLGRGHLLQKPFQQHGPHDLLNARDHHAPVWHRVEEDALDDGRRVVVLQTPCPEMVLHPAQQHEPRTRSPRVPGVPGRGSAPDGGLKQLGLHAGKA
mmetsp:Transcript_84998/g.237163  ORF Transcript_84998/g.237163 Transcript_84998/m.237163 type:complete len:272 (+) Transcript_84998:105-920(+)